ncbi:MAG TPA: radical SAM protein [Candidatus Latescibacteria bacterium]|nr:radical SAM protein [Candidatus Latescibacterota bacterium]
MTSKKLALLEERIDAAYKMLESCHVCPRRCGVNRIKGETGACALGRNPAVSSVNLHFGEEPPISGYRGSGTIFFTSCNLRCVFCQNYPISQLRHGREVSVRDLADAMLKLQDRGAHNINFVTPTHLVPQIMDALRIAYERGLEIPLVYNTGGYDSVEMLRLLDGVVEIYMPDMKYSDSEMGRKYSGIPDYLQVNREAIKEMHRQVGDLVIDGDGVARKGLLVRHLVLPEGIAGTEGVLKFLAEEVSKDTYVSLMRQYFPAYKAVNMPPLNRRVTEEEYGEAVELLEKYGLTRGWIQE